LGQRKAEGCRQCWEQRFGRQDAAEEGESKIEKRRRTNLVQKKGVLADGGLPRRIPRLMRSGGWRMMTSLLAEIDACENRL
jgi:hypothetical protein